MRVGLVERRFIRTTQRACLTPGKQLWRRGNGLMWKRACGASMESIDGFFFVPARCATQSGRIVRWYGIKTDIDDRKQAEEELRRSEAFLAEGERLSLSGSFLWRLDTDEITFSEQLYRIHEFDRDSPVTLERIEQSNPHPGRPPAVVGKRSRGRGPAATASSITRSGLRMPNGSVRSTCARLPMEPKTATAGPRLSKVRFRM